MGREAFQIPGKMGETPPGELPGFAMGGSMISLEEIWQQVLQRLQADMPRASFETWVRETKVVSLEKNILTVSARNTYTCEWLESRLTATVQNILKGILDTPASVCFVLDPSHQEDEQELEEEEETGLDIEAVQWLDYDRIVQPHQQVVVKGYLRRLGMEIGPKAIWLYIGFHQAAWRAQGLKQADARPLHSREVMRFSALSHGAFWRLLKHATIQDHLHGLVQRAEDGGIRRFRRGRDGRPHRVPVRYRVFMTPRLTRMDALAIHARIRSMTERNLDLNQALQELLSVEDVMDLLAPMEATCIPVPLNTVMDIARLEAGAAHTAETELLAQALHRRIINALGDIHITHFFITRTVHEFNLTPAQAWLVTVARDMAFINARTGERRDLVTFKGGYQEMAELIGSGRYKTVQAWLNPQWREQRGGNLSRFLMEMPIADARMYDDLRVESMPRAFRVLLEEPLDAGGTNMADANGRMVWAQLEGSAVANGSHMGDANGTALNSFKHTANTKKKNTPITRHACGVKRSGEAMPLFWELEVLLQQNDVHPRVQKELLEVQASVHAFVSWVLYVASPKSGNLSDPLGYAISRLRENPMQEARGVFRQFADLPPAELWRLMETAPSSAYDCSKSVDHQLAHAWRKTMGIRNAMMAQVRSILFGTDEEE